MTTGGPSSASCNDAIENVCRALKSLLGAGGGRPSFSVPLAQALYTCIQTPGETKEDKNVSQKQPNISAAGHTVYIHELLLRNRPVSIIRRVGMSATRLNETRSTHYVSVLRL